MKMTLIVMASIFQREIENDLQTSLLSYIRYIKSTVRESLDESI